MVCGGHESSTHCAVLSTHGTAINTHKTHCMNILYYTQCSVLYEHTTCYVGCSHTCVACAGRIVGLYVCTMGRTKKGYKQRQDAVLKSQHTRVVQPVVQLRSPQQTPMRATTPCGGRSSLSRQYCNETGHTDWATSDHTVLSAR